MNFSKIDRLVRLALLAFIGSTLVVAGLVRCGKTSETMSALGTFHTTNLVVDQLAGFGTTAPTQQVQVESSGRVCSPGVNDCLPVQITEYAVAAPSVSFRRAFGTQAAPTSLTALGNFIAQLRGCPYTTTGFVCQNGLPQVFIEYANAETGSPTATAQGTYLGGRTVPVGGVNSTMGWKLDAAQGLNGGNFGLGVFDTAPVPAKLTVVSDDVGSGAGTSATAWDSSWATFGSAINVPTGAGLGLGYSSTDDQAVIASSKPGAAFKPIAMFTTQLKMPAGSTAVPSVKFGTSGGVYDSGANGVSITNGGFDIIQAAAVGPVLKGLTQVDRVFNATLYPGVVCDGGVATAFSGGEWKGSLTPAIDTTTCALTFAHNLASCTTTFHAIKVEVATGIGPTYSYAGAVLTVTAAPTWALGAFDWDCSALN